MFDGSKLTWEVRRCEGESTSNLCKWIIVVFIRKKKTTSKNQYNDTILLFTVSSRWHHF